ncbi:CDP-diacylglycerol--glycerol-3-phosphate 3-phosphatidyltransferase [Actinospica durhamensis]|uniref:CDP-diacylglycerol--glycerol-3-phosphate 3-phosphatidyltransferase n=1 Tax=Actinospica durhamensis TaxID=1508375 RepID=A0A941IMZ4_9ACTN|nr:CDP-diacylglycerol--glycerol-3-phosphate 3-phosphatidyltransferase [Actinospica durhamensis]
MEADDEASAPAPKPPVPLLNIANILTAARIVLVPVFVAALMHDGGHSTAWRLTAAAVFFLASATDRLDGELARKHDLITDFGKIADPIADKALIGSALICLSLLHELWWWVTVVILVREIGITLMRFWVIRYGVIAASPGGKLKTVVQSLAIFLYVLPLAGVAWLQWSATVVMAAALLLTVGTGVDYVARAVRLRTGAGGAR